MKERALKMLQHHYFQQAVHKGISIYQLPAGISHNESFSKFLSKVSVWCWGADNNLVDGFAIIIIIIDH